MAKRFTDTDIWKNQRWFRKLSPEYKLSFCYIKDECNHAGIWRIDCSDLIEDLGLKEFDLDDFILSVNTEFDKITGKKSIKERILIVNSTYLWITGFIQFQYEGKDRLVNSDAAPVKTSLTLLQGLGILEQGLSKNFIRLKKDLQEGCITPKDKDKDKDKDKYKGGMGENKKLRGIKFSDDLLSVIFADGSMQNLGEGQIKDLKRNNLSPNSLIKGFFPY